MPFAESVRVCTLYLLPFLEQGCSRERDGSSYWRIVFFDSSTVTRNRRPVLCVPSILYFSFLSFFLFAYLFEGSKLSVKIRDHRIVGEVGEYSTRREWRENIGGKKEREKKEKKNAVEASRVHENVRDRGEERLDEGARSKGSWKGNVNLWDHVDRSHARLFLYYYPPLAFYLRVYLLVTPFSPRS